MTSAKLCGQCVCLGGGLGDTGEGIWQGECQHFCDGDSTAQKTLSPPPIPCMRRPKKQKKKKKVGLSLKPPSLPMWLGRETWMRESPPPLFFCPTNCWTFHLYTLYSTLYIVGLSIYYSTKYKSCWIFYIWLKFLKMDIFPKSCHFFSTSVAVFEYFWH